MKKLASPVSDMRKTLDTLACLGETVVPASLYPDGWLARADAIAAGRAEPRDWEFEAHAVRSAA